VTSRPAVAALGYLNTANPGRIFPIAINWDWLMKTLKLPVPKDGVTFNPDGQDNGGWCSPLDYPASAANLKNWMDNGFPESLSIGNEINLNNGTVDAAVQDLDRNLPSRKSDYTLADGTPFRGWMVVTPVITVDKFNRQAHVIAWQSTIILSVDSKGQNKVINVAFYDKPVLVTGGHAGGPKSNVYAAIPKLVE
jgi:hypothetical protein